MADTAVEHLPQLLPKKHYGPPVPLYVENPLDLMNSDSGDSYSSYKKLQRELEYIHLQEEYIKDEQRFGTQIFTHVW